MDEFVRDYGTIYTCILQRHPAVAVAFMYAKRRRADGGREILLHIYDHVDGVYTFQRAHYSEFTACNFIASGYYYCSGVCACRRCEAAMLSPPAGHSD